MSPTWGVPRGRWRERVRSRGAGLLLLAADATTSSRRRQQPLGTPHAKRCCVVVGLDRSAPSVLVDTCPASLKADCGIARWKVRLGPAGFEWPLIVADDRVDRPGRSRGGIRQGAYVVEPDSALCGEFCSGSRSVDVVAGRSRGRHINNCRPDGIGTHKCARGADVRIAVSAYGITRGGVLYMDVGQGRRGSAGVAAKQQDQAPPLAGGRWPDGLRFRPVASSCAHCNKARSLKCRIC